MKKVRGYNFSRTFMGERVAQHIQNIVIREFCKKEKLSLLLGVTEYSMQNSIFILEQIIDDMKNVDGIVAYSIFQLPFEDLKRNEILSKILKLKKTIYFANEGFKISNKREAERVKTIWLLKKTLDNCPNIKDYGKINKYCF